LDLKLTPLKDRVEMCLWCVSGGLGLPAKEEKMSSAKAAAAGPQQPEEGVFDCIPHADISEFD
jgi:hypothetical protein